jgi:hypothetical protein
MKTGRYNVGVGLLVMAGFMLYGFLLIYLRDFAPDKEAWVASYSVGKHFEARLAHVHGNLFALLNLALGFVLVRLAAASDRARTAAAGSASRGCSCPPASRPRCTSASRPIFVLLGAVSMTASVVLTGVLALKHWGDAAEGGMTGATVSSSPAHAWRLAAGRSARPPSCSASRRCSRAARSSSAAPPLDGGRQRRLVRAGVQLRRGLRLRARRGR